MQIGKPQEDTYLHKGMRKQLVDTLRNKGIKDEKVLAAINNVPRHFFLDTAFERIAYEDRAFEILAKQTISHPFTVAFQTELLQIKKFDKVLEIGTGSAYQSCILAELGAMVFSIERQRELYDFVDKNFSFIKKYPTIKRFYGDGYAGKATFAPFDKIIVTAGAPFVPDKLIEQLKPGGIFVIPVGDENGQRMLKITKEIDHKIITEELGDFDFVPMLEGRNG
jgi:protein-L-isoaspartate(D-aspartate) O-methyltransferase